MVSRRTNFGERSEPAPDRGGKFQSAGGRHKVTRWYMKKIRHLRFLIFLHRWMLLMEIYDLCKN